jgi:hypothetical protein
VKERIPFSFPIDNSRPIGVVQETKMMISAIFLIIIAVHSGYGQPAVEGVSDRTVYRDVVTFRVAALDGHETAATLNGKPITVGESVKVNSADYYELWIDQSELPDGVRTRELVRFIVAASERGGSELGLPIWTPHPSIPSSAEEFAGSQLELLAPSVFPRGYPIPAVAWVRRPEGGTIRANARLEAPNQPAIIIRRGVGSGFLEADASAEMLLYEPRARGIEGSHRITIEDDTQWIEAAGVLEGAWGENQRVHITADSLIPAEAELMIGPGTVVRLAPGVSITVEGRLTVLGRTDAPVVFMPNHPGEPWGGFLLRKNSSELIATAAIFTGSGANPNWFSDNGYKSHRLEECLFFCENAPSLVLNDCAAIDLAGQFGHAVNGGRFEFTRCLVQRCSTAGEYTGSTFIATDSAFIEFPDDSPLFIDEDNDALYLVSGTFTFTNTLFGWAKDDAIDCGASGVGTLTLEGCWFESVFHEGVALSGAKIVTARDTVFMDCGQGFEVGYSGPIAVVDHCLAIGNLSGVRFGDNYNWAYSGFLTVTNSILLSNYRDVFGHTWNTTGSSFDTNQWVERILQMDIRGNYLTAANQYHLHNMVWEPEADGSRLAPFLTTPPGAKPGVGFALHSEQLPASSIPNGVPVRLSTFALVPTAVSFVTETSNGNRNVQKLEFQPGETLKSVTIQAADMDEHGVIRIRLEDPDGCEITGIGTVLLLSGEAAGSKLHWARLRDDVVLYWQTAGAVLEYAEALEGPWTSFADQSSPATVQAETAQKFFRLVQQ